MATAEDTVEKNRQDRREWGDAKVPERRGLRAENVA